MDDLVELVPFVPADNFERFCVLLESAIAERREAPLGVLVQGREIVPWTEESEVELASILRAARERRERGETAGALDQLRTEVLRRHPEGRAVFKPQVTPRADGNFDVRVGHVSLVMGLDPTTPLSDEESS